MTKITYQYYASATIKDPPMSDKLKAKIAGVVGGLNPPPDHVHIVHVGTVDT